EELVAHAAALLGRRHRPVGPQVAPADARSEHPDQGLGGFAQRRVGHILYPDVAGAVDQGCSHQDSLPLVQASRFAVGGVPWVSSVLPPQAVSYEPDERGTSLIVVERAPGLVMLSVMLFAYRRYWVR